MPIKIFFSLLALNFHILSMMSHFQDHEILSMEELYDAHALVQHWYNNVNVYFIALFPNRFPIPLINYLP